MAKKIYPEILIVSNRYDYSTDHVACQLNKRKALYLRLNRDQFTNCKITLIPVTQRMFGEINDIEFEVNSNTLKVIYFRAPIYLRDIYQPDLSPDEQLARSQWAAFLRALMVFENIFWVNHPQATYKAEVKPYQLYLAKKIGFNIANTLISNNVSQDVRSIAKSGEIIVKTLSSGVLRIGNKEAFIYTNITKYNELLGSELSTAPVILQKPLLPKIDIRVTVVADLVFAVDIRKDNEGLSNDWRLEKDNIQYNIIELPSDVKNKCVRLVKELGLKFGAIDLIFSEKEYYFIEVNPTGEWAWLMKHVDLNIDEEIAKLLISEGEMCQTK